MPNAETSMHIYQRAISGESQDSLSIIAELIEPGQTLLDLGMGTGGLGHYLSTRHSIVADGVSLNPAEADLARAWYRQALVADLDRDDLGVLFPGQLYDCIVCADVLEHLKAPQNILAQCKALLKPGGRLITSVPNAGYCGLVAELIQGEFRYRPEGLLDSTHLRFFTRMSLHRFFDENGWTTQSVQTTQRSLLASEFNVAFDALPPAVARHLLALPDALTYQFISVLQPVYPLPQSSVASSAGADVHIALTGPATALFSAELFLAIQGRYDESIKIVASGRIGDPRQELIFDIPASSKAYTHIRIDPADRPGFFRLHYLKINLSDGQLLWQWQAGEDSLSVLADAPQQQLLISSPWETASGALMLLYGDDPWVELPVDAQLLQKITEYGARFTVCVGWPMSADFLQASAAMSNLQTSHDQSLAMLRQQTEYLNQKHAQEDSARVGQIDELSRARLELQAEVGVMSTSVEGLQDEKQKLIATLRSAQRERNALLAQFNQIALHLQTIEHSTLFRVTRPLVHLKTRMDRFLGQKTQKNATRSLLAKKLPVPISSHAVDIIVPVFRGLEDTQCCLESVLASLSQTNWRLIVINDCSPEPEVTKWLRVFALRDSRIELLENSENLGFVATVNRGMALSQDNDVLLLNSDAEVANDWLDRLQHAAYSGLRVASVTPFSNNATICSYPRFCEANDLPNGHTTASLDHLFAKHLAGQSVEVPTGVGFCMYIRRQCLHEIGLFDVDNFGKGYGEENDFCIRAQNAGWVNLHALDTFVRHAGGVSFGDAKSARELQAMETLRRLHPRYESDVHAFVQQDPARQARLLVDIARITAGGAPVILNVMHDRAGGTLRHVQELAHELADQAKFLRLSPAPGGVELRLEGRHEAFAVRFSLPADQSRMLQTLRQFQVAHIHFHHLLGHAFEIMELPAQLGVTHDFTAHDFYSYCPQISLTNHTDSYCGELGLNQCRQCLIRNPAPGGETIESWRNRSAQLLSQARYLITPSADAGQRMQRFVPSARVQVVPHTAISLKPLAYPKPNPRALRDAQPLKIVVLGALSRIKGADILEEVAILAARNNTPLEFHLLGHAYRSLRTPPKARLTVHGGYEEKDLPVLLQWLQPDVVWFPAVWPETYSYTLSASLESGLPIIAPNIGAFAERLQNRDWTWLCDWRQSGSQWLEFFQEIRQKHFSTAVGPGPVETKCLDFPTEKLQFEYHGRYIQSLPKSISLDTDQLLLLQSQIVPNQRYQGFRLTSVVLRILVFLRGSRVFSPLAMVVPMHLQRRIKSSLGK